MPWKSIAPGKFSFSGPITYWMESFQKWFQEDAKNTPDADYSAYIFILTASYANLAKQKWSNEWLGKRKVQKLDSMVGSDPQNNIKMNVLDTLDYLAENLDRDDRINWSSQCRAQARSLLKFK